MDGSKAIKTARLAAIAGLAVFASLALGSQEPAERYLLGPNDQITVSLRDIKEIDFKPVRVDAAGDIQLQYAGKVRASGLTVEQLADAIGERLKAYVNDPHVAVEVSDYGSQPVSVLGAVNKPGTYQLRGQKSLVEVLSLAEGMRNDSGHSITVTRRSEWGAISLPNAKTDPVSGFSTVELSAADIMHSRNPAVNMLIRPHDVVSVPRAELVYVVGAVRRPGGFVLGEKAWLTVLQAVSMAEGLESGAAPQKAAIIRTGEDPADRTEITINIKQILSNKVADPRLQANDILFIPNSITKSVTARSIEAAIQLATGVAIFRR